MLCEYFSVLPIWNLSSPIFVTGSNNALNVCNGGIGDQKRYQFRLIIAIKYNNVVQLFIS